MPGAVDLIGEAVASPEYPLSAGGTQRKRKGLGKGRKGKRRLCGAGEGAVVGALENGALHAWGGGEADGAVVVNGGGWCAVVEVGAMVNGFERTRVHEFDINALPEMSEEEGRPDESRECGGPRNGADSVNAVGEETVKLELETSSAHDQEVELKNGWDASAQAKGDESLEDSKVTSVEVPKKRRRLSGKEVATDMPLRRSARRAASATLPSPPSVHLSSKDVRAEKPYLEKKCSVEVYKEIPVLPPSSKDLEFDGLPVLDVFSVYSCLRSFSTLLFLSPFSLNAFLAALKCDFANSLIDSVHYSILQALKPHLDGLSEEGCQLASDCLRHLNWELLDIVNWPLYLAEYLLVHHSVLSSELKLLNREYYKQPAAKKLEVLRNLCDDAVEIEVIRSELDRRISESEVNAETSQNVDAERKGNDVDMSELQSTFLSKEVLKETSDGNNDECRLCRMDGNLICCDGCPAAFHSRCVGMARDLLPEGEWFCPECQVPKVDRDVKTLQPFHGAEILGVDPHGRIYFGCCGYLLVSESSDMDTSYHFYNKDDLGSVIELFKTSYISYAHIACSISNYWGISTFSTSSGFDIHQDGHVDHVDVADRLASQMVSSLNDELAEGENMVEREQYMNSSSRGYYQSCTASESCKFDSATKSQFSGLTFPDTCSDVSAASVQVHGCTAIPVLQRSEATCSRNSSNAADADSSSKCTEPTQEKHNESPNVDNKLLPPEKTNVATQVHLEIGDYVNCYSFGRIASSVAEELSKSSGDATKDQKVSAEGIVSAQLRAIYKKSINRYWSAIQRLPVNALKERCGWCFACKNGGEQECLFRIIENKILVGSRNRTIGLHSKDNGTNHILSVVHHILHIEDSIHGLLSGPWQNPHHKRQWRKNVFKANDVTSLKYMLLTLELHLRRVAFTAEWMKAVDSNLTVGSASYILTSERGVHRKQGKKNILETKRTPESGFSSLSKSTSAPGIYWWRGGRLSRKVFHWKMLPQSLASKGARQAGCRKIPGILYPEGSEFARRIKYVAWRAAVEMSQNVAQLTYQVKDLDSNIRWNDLSSSQPLPQLAKESRKSSRPSWKATICQKCVEVAHVKYLLDFGKRKSIPDVVTRHGLLHEGPSSEGKKYWLDETHIPINLLKAFEVRKLEQMRTSSEVIPIEGNKCIMAKPRRKRGLSDLLSRGEKSDQSRCGHCDKVVLEREESVNCRFCKGLIHKKHFRVPKGVITTTYTCYGCKDKKFLNGSRDNKIPNGCNDKKFVSKVKGKKSVDGSKGKKKLMDGGTGRTSVIGKNRKHVDTDEKLLHERKCKRLVDGCHEKKLSNGHRGKQIVKGFWNKKSMDGTNDKKFVNEFKDRRIESRPRKRKRKLGKSKILAVRKSERLAKKKQYVAKTKKRKVGRKKAKQSLTRKDQSMVCENPKDEISWPKRQRTGICPPYWLNGLLWTRKAYDEHAIHFRETRVLLPFPKSKDNLQPVCSLCHKEYDSHVIYVGCDNCGDWFHGDAFALTLVNINNIRGFKCHRCRIKSTPVCPYLSGVVGEVNLLKEKNLTVNHLIDYHRRQCLVHDNQDLLHGYDYSDVVHSHEFMDENKRAVSMSDSGQILTVRECDETSLGIEHTDKESLLVTEAEHSCMEQDEVKVIGEVVHCDGG